MAELEVEETPPVLAILQSETTALLGGAQPVTATYDTIAHDLEVIEELSRPVSRLSNRPPPDPIQANNPNVAIPIDGDGQDSFPTLEILILCFARTYEPLAFFCIFPLVNQMIYSTNSIPATSVGFYAGLIESLFSVVQMFFLIPFGRLSDRIGRKPVLVFSISGVALFMGLFGFSKTITQMILFRSGAGMFAGMSVTLGAMVAEKTTLKTRARAYSWFAFASSCGVFLGPLLGGMLAEPAKLYPGVFAGTFFESHPFALSTLAVGGVGFLSAASCLWLEETLQKPSISTDAGTADLPPEQKAMPLTDLLKSPGVLIVTTVFTYVMIILFAMTAVQPVFWFTPITLGGFGFGPPMISLFQGIAGAAQVIWLLVVFPWLLKKYSTRTVVSSCAKAWPVYFGLHPVCQVLLRRKLVPEFWLLGVLLQVGGSGVIMAFEAMQLCLVEVNPRPDTLSTLSAIVYTTINAARAVTPAAFSSLFAVGVSSQVLGGYMAWIVLIALTVVLLIMVRWLPSKTDGIVKRLGSEED